VVNQAALRAEREREREEAAVGQPANRKTASAHAAIAKDKERKGAIHLGGCCTTQAVCVNSPMAARARGWKAQKTPASQPATEKYIYVDKVEFIIFQLLNMT
jgi:hypothetical protein